MARTPPKAGTLGRRIYDRRRALFLTQAELAAKCKLGQSTIAQWERNTAVPSLRVRPKVAKVLRMDPAELFGDVDRREASA